MPRRRVRNCLLCSGRARPALPLPAARGRGRNRRRGAVLEKGQPVCKGGGGAAPLPARLRPRVQAGRAAPLPGCGRQPAAARSWHGFGSSPARWVSSGRPGVHRRGAGFPSAGGSAGDQPRSPVSEASRLHPPRPPPAAAPPRGARWTRLGNTPAWLLSAAGFLPGPVTLASSASFCPELATGRAANARRHSHRKREELCDCKKLWKEGRGPTPTHPPPAGRPPARPVRCPSSASRTSAPPGVSGRAPYRSALPACTAAPPAGGEAAPGCPPTPLELTAWADGHTLAPRL